MFYIILYTAIVLCIITLGFIAFSKPSDWPDYVAVAIPVVFSIAGVATMGMLGWLAMNLM